MYLLSPKIRLFIPIQRIKPLILEEKMRGGEMIFQENINPREKLS